MSIDGLQKTSTGETKVIDVQDFTGEGDINYYDCDVDEQDGKYYFVNEDKDYKVAGADKLSYKSTDDKYYIGAIEESSLKNSNSNSEDLNGNGKTTDKYYFVVFQTKEGDKTFWVAYFDTNDNGDLSDEKPIRNYKDKFDYFQIKNEKGLPKLTFALNIFPEEKKINLFYDDGAHGTHVAGIAAGYHIGNTYLNGIAPGAKLIGLKIGNNNFAGGATVTESMKKAFQYADKVSKERKEPCILNMSFGIGSEIEGRSDMEQFLDKLLKDNHYLYVCVANGNDGPGISTAGLPASSNYILSSGAVLAQEVGRDLFGTTLKRDIVLYFSSRGGEVSKPDVCSPGACTSTVPNWQHGDRFWGTSMASPYSTGVVSLLMSAMVKEYPAEKIPSQLVFKAIKNGATEMEGYTPLDEGSGYINVDNAYSLLKKYIDEGEVKNLETYSISSFAPNMPNGRSDNLYIRDGSYLNGNETYSYTIKRNNYQDIDKFYRIYRIKSNSDWLIPIQKKTYIRNDQSTNVTVKFDMKKLTEPGLYVGKISGVRDDKSRMPEFSMLATVVIPYKFNQSNNYSQSWNNDTIEPGMIKRFFIEVPAGFPALHVALTSIKDKYTFSRFRLFDPDGVNLYLSPMLMSQHEGKNVEKNFYNLRPGVYELDVEGFILADQNSNYNLSAQFTGIDRVGDTPIDSVNNNIKVVSSNDLAQAYSLSGKILGYRENKVIELKGKSMYSIPFTFMKGEASKEFTVTLSKEDFNKVTDFSMLIYDKDGKALVKDGLSYREGSVSIDNKFKSDTTNLTFTLVPAFANAPGKITIFLKEETDFDNPVDISVKDNGRASTTLYPAILKTLDCEFSKPDIAIPNDSNFFGKIYFESSATKNIDYELPILFNF